MNAIERSEILSSLHRLKADASALFVKCKDLGLVAASGALEKNRDELGVLIDDLHGKPAAASQR